MRAPPCQPPHPSLDRHCHRPWSSWPRVQEKRWYQWRRLGRRSARRVRSLQHSPSDPYPGLTPHLRIPLPSPYPGLWPNPPVHFRPSPTPHQLQAQMGYQRNPRATTGCLRSTRSDPTSQTDQERRWRAGQERWSTPDLGMRRTPGWPGSQAPQNPPGSQRAGDPPASQRAQGPPEQRRTQSPSGSQTARGRPESMQEPASRGMRGRDLGRFGRRCAGDAGRTGGLGGCGEG